MNELVILEGFETIRNMPKTKNIYKQEVVYIAEFEDLIKIGRTSNPQKRIRTLTTQSGRNIKRVAYTKPILNYSKIEREMHKIFKENRTVGEYFDLPFAIACEQLKKLKLETATEKQLSEFEKQDKETIEKFSKTIRSMNEYEYKKYYEDFEPHHCEYCCIPITLHPELEGTGDFECKINHFIVSEIEDKEDNQEEYSKETLLREYENTLKSKFKDIKDKKMIIDKAIEIADDLFYLEHYVK
jgi:hypothetical protein